MVVPKLPSPLPTCFFDSVGSLPPPGGQCLSVFFAVLFAFAESGHNSIIISSSVYILYNIFN